MLATLTGRRKRTLDTRKSLRFLVGGLVSMEEIGAMPAI